MGLTNAIGIGIAGIAVIAAYFYLKPPDLGKVKEDIDKTTHEGLVQPFFNLFGYDTTLEGDTVHFKPKGPQTLILPRNIIDKTDGSKITIPAGTTIHPNGKIVGPNGGPTGGIPDYLRAAAIRRRRELGLGPGPHGGGR